MGDLSPAELSPSELLPAIYRAVLDRVAELERRGERLEASRFRTEAIHAYSRSWDLRGRRRLEAILRRAERTIADTPEPAPESVAELVTDGAQPASRSRKRGVATTA